MVGSAKAKWISLFLMITHIKHIKRIFMRPAYLSLKWVEFKKIFVHAPSRIRMLAIKQKNIIQSTIVCTYFWKLVVFIISILLVLEVW